MSKFTGTKTEKNLAEAFAGESQAHTKYLYYASAAKKEGYEQIADIFTETAGNEKEHAKMWFKYLHDGIGKTTENLLAAAAGENFEWTDMYARMAREADEEGFTDVANFMRGVAAVEARHEKRYLKLAANIEEALVYARVEEKTWKCRNCGHVHFGKEAPAICPVCSHPQAYFEIIAENY